MCSLLMFIIILCATIAASLAVIIIIVIAIAIIKLWLCDCYVNWPIVMRAELSN